LKRNEG